MRVAAALAGLCIALASAAAFVVFFPWHVPTPVFGETVALAGTDVSRLVWPPDEVKAVYSYTDHGARTYYKAGVDYEVTDTGIRRTANSPIYDFLTYRVETTADGRFEWRDEPRNPPVVMWHHVYVDYVADLPARDEIPAKRTAPVVGRVVVAGDSIVAGINAVIDRGTTQDAWLNLITDHFADRFQVESMGWDGASLDTLQHTIETLLQARPIPAVLIIALGMNDHTLGDRRLPAFESLLEEIVGKARSVGVSVILVGFPHSNKQWISYSAEQVSSFNDAIERVALKRDVPFVDIAAAFKRARTFKSTIELFGDNYHHPGSYGQRLYFSEVLPYLLTEPVSAAQVPAFIRLP